jgi:hypothetical protein
MTGFIGNNEFDHLSNRQLKYVPLLGFVLLFRLQ